MLPTYTHEDFVGLLALGGDTFNEQYFDVVISQMQEEITAEYLGADALYDITNNDRPKWDAMFQGGTYSYYDECEGVQKRGYFKGLKWAILNNIYFRIVRDDFTMTDTGAVINTNENSINVNQKYIAKDRLNTAVKYYNEVCQYFDRLEEITTDIDTSIELGGVYTITYAVTEPSLLSDGETVTMNGVDYVISNKTEILNVDVIIGESFEVTAPTGLIFDEFTYSPYKDVEYEKSDYLVL